MKVFNLPDLGEGLPDAEIQAWHIAEGDTVDVDQPLVSMETAKAVVDIPSPWAGKISVLHGKVGDIIPTGHPLISFSKVDGEIEKHSTSVVGELETSNEQLFETIITPQESQINHRVKTTPALRALAKKLNVNLADLTPSGQNGTVIQRDIENAAKKAETKEGFEPLLGTRRVMAETMSQAHKQVVPITIWEDANIHHWKKDIDITVRVIQAIVTACQEEPSLNAWYDSEKKAYKLHKGVHIGIAMDTREGLFVPVIHDSHNKTALELRNVLEDYKKQVVSRSISPKNLQGATISLSNFGNFTGRYATPIVVPPTVAILAIGKIYKKCVEISHKVEARSFLPLSLSVDHRVITGGEATRFLGVIVEQLEI